MVAKCRRPIHTPRLEILGLGGERPGSGSGAWREPDEHRQKVAAARFILALGVPHKPHLSLCTCVVASRSPSRCRWRLSSLALQLRCKAHLPQLVLVCCYNKLGERKDACGVRMAFLPRYTLVQNPREGYMNDGGWHVCAVAVVRRSSSSTISPSLLDPQNAVTCERGAPPS